MTVQECQAEDRMLVEGVRGRELAWLMTEGGRAIVHMATMRADLCEVPRTPAADLDGSLGSTLEEIAETLASQFEMEILKVCHWPAGHFTFGDTPDAVGVVLAKPLN